MKNLINFEIHIILEWKQNSQMYLIKFRKTSNFKSVLITKSQNMQRKFQNIFFVKSRKFFEVFDKCLIQRMRLIGKSSPFFGLSIQTKRSFISIWNLRSAMHLPDTRMQLLRECVSYLLHFDNRRNTISLCIQHLK